MSDDGAARVDAQGSVLIAARDVPLVYMGSMQHHLIQLCNGKTENNDRPLYSLGYEQQLGNKLQNGSVGLLSV